MSGFLSLMAQVIRYTYEIRIPLGPVSFSIADYFWFTMYATIGAIVGNRLIMNWFWKNF